MLVGLDRSSLGSSSLERSSLFSVQGKVALLTGASGFLGRTFAETLLANGADLIAVGRSAKLSQQEQVWTEKYGPGRVHCYYVDMYDLEALAVLKRLLKVDDQGCFGRADLQCLP